MYHYISNDLHLKKKKNMFLENKNEKDVGYNSYLFLKQVPPWK